MTKTSAPATTNRNQLRQHFRRLRRDLSHQQQHDASESLAQQVINLKVLFPGQRIAIYLASDGEIDPQPIADYCWKHGIDVYLPVMHPFCKGYLLFQHYHHHVHLKPNVYGIAEPVLNCAQVSPVEQLDIIFTPLVAFDADCNRMGMGGGFYDRTLAPLTKNNRLASNTKLIGIAHDCQQADHLPFQSWDVPLSQIITPKQVFSRD